MIMTNNIVSEVALSYKNRVPYNQRQKVITSHSAYEVLTNIFPADTIDYRETFIVLYLNKASQVLGYSIISEGGTASVSVDVKLIIQAALLANASAIIIAHNHPSGNLRPSIEDNRLTKRVAEAAKLFDIAVLDHLIVTSESFYSFSDNGDI
jgi:DNA repair protein RadC